MNNLPRQKIKEIVTQYGHSVYYDPQLCKALLKVFCGQYRKEISVLKLNCRLFWFLYGNEVYTDSLFDKIVLKVLPDKYFTIP